LKNEGFLEDGESEMRDGYFEFRNSNFEIKKPATKLGWVFCMEGSAFN